MRLVQCTCVSCNKLASFPGLPTIQFLIAYSAQIWRGNIRPGLFYHTNNVNVYLAGGKGPWQTPAHYAHCCRIMLFLYSWYFYQLCSVIFPIMPNTQRLRDSSDRIGALSRSSNDTVNSEDVDSVSLGILPELWYELLHKSDIAIFMLAVPSVIFTRSKVK